MGPARAIRQVTKRRVRLGRTGLTVSTLCFGTGYMGGSVASGARLLTRAYDLGITFWDASDDYGTHPHVAQALREVGRDGGAAGLPEAPVPREVDREDTTPESRPQPIF